MKLRALSIFLVLSTLHLTNCYAAEAQAAQAVQVSQAAQAAPPTAPTQVVAPVNNPSAAPVKAANTNAIADAVNVVSCSAGGGTPFQRLICDSLGSWVPVYGASLVNSFASENEAQISVDYPVGPGDELLLKVWGSVDLSNRLVVDRNGAIFIPTVGNILVAGTPFGQLENVIAKAIAVYYKDLKIALSMGQIRSITVYMTGMANSPGRLSVNSNSTLLNAVLAAGGVGSQGSLRNIELRRMGQLVGKFDLYDLLLKGDKTKDLRIQSGDVIFIPPVGAQVALLGTIKMPAIYELKGGETAQDILQLAGGETILNRAGRVQVEQVKDKEVRIARTIPESELASFKLSNGDILRWSELTMKYSSVVNLRSSLGISLREAWTPGMKVSDLIRSKEFLLTPAYWSGLNKGVFASAQSGGGQVNQVRTLSRNVGEEINWEYAAILRRDPINLTSNLIGFNLAKALQKEPAADIELQADDVITIFHRDEIRSPMATKAKFVTIEGEIAVPGVYQLQANESLQDLVARAGGVTADAWLYAAELGRESVRQQQKKSLNEMADEMEMAHINLQSKTLQTTLTASNVAAKGQTDFASALISKMRNAQPIGRIVLGLAPNGRTADLPQTILEDGDRFYVPRKPSTVVVAGHVYNQNGAYLFNKNKSLEDYLNMAGGFKEGANEEQVFIMRADGSIVGTKKEGWFTVSALNQKALPGDAIIVPQQLDKTTWMKGLLDWTQILANFGTGMAAIKLLGK